MFYLYLNYIPKSMQDQWILEIERKIKSKKILEIDEKFINEAFNSYIPERFKRYYRNIPELVKEKQSKSIIVIMMNSYELLRIMIEVFFG